MKSINQTFQIFLLVFTAIFFNNCERTIVNEANDITPTPNALEFMALNQDVSMLNNKLDELDLRERLMENPFTFFAPTNEAFERIVEENPAYSSVADIPTDVLKMLIDYHFITQKRIILRDTFADYINSSNNLSQFDAFASIFVKTEGSIRLNGQRNVALQDVRVTNGVIHLLDEFIEVPNVLKLIESNPQLAQLTDALNRTDFSTNFMETLNGNGTFTVFAPTDSAFIQLLVDLELDGLEQIPTERLESILSYHISATDNLRSAVLINDLEINTLGDNTIKIAASGQKIILDGISNNAAIIATDGQGTNGVVHLIDKVLLPN